MWRNDGAALTDYWGTRIKESNIWWTNPFKVQVNFDIPTFQGKIDANVVDDWLSKLERYFCVNNFSNIEKITFALLKVENHVKLAWEAHEIAKEDAQNKPESNLMFNNTPTWEEYVEHI